MIKDKEEIRTDYSRTIGNDGLEVDIISYYKTDHFTISNPPDHLRTIDKLRKILKGTGIAKITLTFLDKNIKGEK